MSSQGTQKEKITCSSVVVVQLEGRQFKVKSFDLVTVFVKRVNMNRLPDSKPLILLLNSLFSMAKGNRNFTSYYLSE